MYLESSVLWKVIYYEGFMPTLRLYVARDMLFGRILRGREKEIAKLRTLIAKYKIKNTYKRLTIRDDV
jgi:hypothetical protein